MDNSLIKRQDAIDTIRNIKEISGTSDDEILLIDKAEVMTELMMMMPSAEPKRKKGKWIEKEVFQEGEITIDEWQSARCSACGKYHTTPYGYFFYNFKFCPCCGADMD